MKTHLRIGVFLGTFWSSVSLVLAQADGGAAAAGGAAPGGAPAGPVGGIPLLEPIAGIDRIPDGMVGLNAFFFYVNTLFPWMLGTAAGICVLMALVGGVQMIISGGDTSARGEGMDRFLWSIGGLILIVFVNLILRLLNPSFYQ